jgi:hypothetical protein
MPRTQFYEPQVGDSPPLEIRGFPVSIGGTYVLMDDVLTVLEAYARTSDSDDVRELVNWLRAGDLHVEEPVETATDLRGQEYTFTRDPAVDRVEVYPDDPENPRPRWIARACSSEGDILHVTNGSFDQEYVIRDAEQRWGTPIHLVADAMVDTVWEENDPGGIRSPHTKRRRPSPKRLWA